MGTVLPGGNEIFQNTGLVPWPKRAGHGLGWEVQVALSACAMTPLPDAVPPIAAHHEIAEDHASPFQYRSRFV
jgi:hypothetical protein